jgi:hypothetical protein
VEPTLGQAWTPALCQNSQHGASLDLSLVISLVPEISPVHEFIKDVLLLAIDSGREGLDGAQRARDRRMVLSLAALRPRRPCGPSGPSSSSTGQLRAFGGLRRVQAPARELLWVCENH